MSLQKEFVLERDTRIFTLRKSGMSMTEIAKRHGISVNAVSKSIQRTLERLNREALQAYPHILQMELERLDSLLASTWPLTQHRKVTLPDGTEMVVEPDVRFVQQAREIIKDRIKMLGLETTNVNMTGTVQEPIRHTLPGVIETTATVVADPKQEAMELMRIMREVGVLGELEAAPVELEGAIDE